MSTLQLDTPTKSSSGSTGLAESDVARVSAGADALELLPLGSASNRSNSSSLSEGWSQEGLDKLVLVADVGGTQRKMDGWRMSMTGSPGGGQHHVHKKTLDLPGGSSALIQVQTVRGGGRIAVVEFNPARIFDPERLRPCPTRQLKDVLHVVEGAVARVVDLSTGIELAGVTRADYAIDLVVADPTVYFDKVLAQDVRHARIQDAHYVKGVGSGVTVGNDRWSVRVYRPHDTRPAVPAKVIRLEVQARKDRLGRHGIVLVHHLDSAWV